MKSHHSKAHGESIAGVEVDCDHCGSSTRVKKTRYDSQDHHFCDQGCMGKWRSDNLSGKDNPLWEGETIECTYCGEERDIPGWQYNNHGEHFCSTECHGKWRSENLTGANATNWSGRVEVSCAQCGASKKIRKKVSNRSEKHFCNTECYSEWRAEHALSGEDHPMWKGGGVTVSCRHCGDEKTVPNNVYESQDRFFCNSDCLGNWLSENRSGENSHEWEGGLVQTNCAECGAALDRRRVRYDRLANSFCNPECQGRWLAKNAVGENAPSWNGGKPNYYGTNWQRNRRKTLERDGHECRVCGVSEKTHRENIGESLHVHHLKPIATFDEPEDANYLKNLVSLCRDCHAKWEGVPVVPPSR